MSDYRNLAIRPLDMGINLVQASDTLQGGKWISLHNVEPIQEAILPTRPGRRTHLDTATGSPIHSMIRLSTSSLLLGIGGGLYRDAVLIDSGYSGNPLTFVSGQDGLIYIGDSSKISIVDAGGSVFKWGISAPTKAAVYSAVGSGTLDSSVAGASGYDWRYTYYSTKTKTESNGSPIGPTIAVVNQQGAVQVFASSDSQVDQIRLYRRGGTLVDVGWLQVTIAPNKTQVLQDNLPDEQLILFDPLLDTNFPPFTSEDLSGNALFEVPLPYIWGPFLGKVIFGTGDPNRPNTVYWTNFDSFGASDVNNHEAVTGTIEPLMNGWMFGSLPFVASRDAVYAIDFGNAGDPTFSVRRTPVGRGISGHWAFAVGPLVYILSKDGIYETDCQSPNVQSITEETLRPIFQGHTIEGQGIPTSTNVSPLVSDEILGPVDFSKDEKLRLTYANHELHFYYEDTTGLPHHLIYHTLYRRWRTAGMGEGVAVRLGYFDVNSITPQLMLATNNGKVYVPDPTAMDDDGIPIEVKAKTGDLSNSFGFGTFQNLMVEAVPADPNGSAVDVNVTPTKGPFDNWDIRFTVPGEVQDGSTLGKPVKSRFSLVKEPLTTATPAQAGRAQFGLIFEWVGRATIRQLMLQYRTENESALFWDSGETSHGLSGWQHSKDLYLALRADSNDGIYTLTRTIDGVSELPYEFIAPTDYAKGKVYIPMKAAKGKLFRYRINAPADPSATIQNDLSAAWKLGEASGNRADSYGVHTLVERGGPDPVPNAEGKVGLAAYQTPSNVNVLRREEASALRQGNFSYSISGWFKPLTLPSSGSIYYAFSKDNASPDREYGVYLDPSDGVFHGLQGTTEGTTFDVEDTLVVEAGNWYFVVFWYDYSAQKIYLQVNNGAINFTSTLGTTPRITTAFFMLGARNSSSPANHWDGYIDALHWHQRILTGQERSYLYNNGRGREVDSSLVAVQDSGFGAGFDINAGECEVRAKPWNTALGYSLINPFQPGDTPGQEP